MSKLNIKMWSCGDKLEKIKDRIVELRRDFHMNPELGGEEVRTSGIVAEILEGLGLKVSRGVAGTGVVGLLEGGSGGRTVALRADMDALPLDDQKEVPYASRVAGKMHACGHDAHTAMLLGAAMVLSDIRDGLKGNVKFIFQPAEENIGGAKRMIEEGVLDNPKVDAIFALHVSPDLEVGQIGLKCGVANASSDEFKIIVEGKSSHGAYPQYGKDAIVIAAQVITALQAVVSRSIDPLQPGVLTIGTIKGGHQCNIVADRVELTGTVRTLNQRIKEEILTSIHQIVKHICLGMGGDCKVLVEPGYPLLVNDSSMVNLLKEAARKVVGDNIVNIDLPRMGVEDFAYFLQEVPGVMWRLGTGNREKGIICTLHNPYFDIDEDALLVGTAVHVQTVLDFLA